MIKPVAIITSGDPAGIGPEVILKGLLNLKDTKFIPVVIGHLRTYTDPRYYDLFVKVNFKYHKGLPNDEFVFNKPIFLEPKEDLRSITIGRGSKNSGRASGLYLDYAVELLRLSRGDFLVTGPLNKRFFQLAGYKFQGHTDYLIAKTGVKDAYMTFITKSLNLILVTHHIPLKEVPRRITTTGIQNLLEFLHKNSKIIGISKPRIAVTGLNPHAGESEMLGREEKEIISPAIQKARAYHLSVDGPLAADAVFRPEVRSRYNIIIAMYHDQGLTAVKALGTAVNVTIGLPFIRTSVDHGTAYDIAGLNKADPGSFTEAVKKGLELYRLNTKQ